jgi:colanic acid/amylovoran biosynthesis protein
MRILLTGQCTLHWGRLEFGNIGNYYIIESSVRELHRVFPNAEIVTTFQMTDEFCRREGISCLPMELFYSWSENDLSNSLTEFGIAQIFHDTGKLVETTPYIEEVKKSDLIIDFSGEMWGYHADLVGKNRFLVGLIKDRVAQLLNKPVVLLAGSQGPFTNEDTKGFAKQVFEDFALVANREGETTDLLVKEGFNIKNLRYYACPAFLFEPKPDNEMSEIYIKERIIDNRKKTFGFVLCGFNMAEGPFDKWPRRDDEYFVFAESIEFIVNTLGARVVLMSHSNGFTQHPNFKLIQGRDYPIAKQLQNVLKQRGRVNLNDVLCLDNPYNPWETKAIIKQFDMFVAGRLHASVAALSQYVPTVIIMHGHGPKSHKIIGFAKIVGIEEYVAYPKSSEELIGKIKNCWESRVSIRQHLNKRIPEVKDAARMSFEAIRSIVEKRMDYHD